MENKLWRHQHILGRIYKINEIEWRLSWLAADVPLAMKVEDQTVCVCVCVCDDEKINVTMIDDPMHWIEWCSPRSHCRMVRVTCDTTKSQSSWSSPFSEKDCLPCSPGPRPSSSLVSVSSGSASSPLRHWEKERLNSIASCPVLIIPPPSSVSSPPSRSPAVHTLYNYIDNNVIFLNVCLILNTGPPIASLTNLLSGSCCLLFSVIAMYMCMIIICSHSNYHQGRWWGAKLAMTHFLHHHHKMSPPDPQFLPLWEYRYIQLNLIVANKIIINSLGPVTKIGRQDSTNWYVAIYTAVKLR